MREVTNTLLPPPCGEGQGGGSHDAAQRKKEESTSFLKKRSKRLLFLGNSQDRGHGPYLAASAETKVFLLLFLQKKKILPTRHPS
jgi:hypothetical protein